MTYTYKTKVGTFAIQPQRTNPSRVELWVGKECYGFYVSARMDAADVSAHASGFDAWDLAQDLAAPEDLAEWDRS